MISDLIVNISLLMSFTFIWHQVFRNNRLTISSPIVIKVMDGMIAGVLGIILMYYSINVNDVTILDLRHIPVILVAFFGGAIPTFIAAIIISLGRFVIDVNISSVTSLFMMMLIAGGASLIAHYVKNNALLKWTFLLLYSQAIFTLALYMVAEADAGLLKVAIYHIISAFLGGYFIYYFVNYIRISSENYRRYKENSQRDSLTGLYNVRMFDRLYNDMLENTKLENSHCSLCLVDVDFFKKINDTYGHQAGDAILKELANLLTAGPDAKGSISRNGGEEFSILLPNCSKGEAVEIAERVRENVEDHGFEVPRSSSIHITVSIGVASTNGEVFSLDDLFSNADSALYYAKKNGRNKVCCYSDITE
ncbi:GGDEF domain-containing protein [Virgibacillus flavescens]|uniref:GGDEF domain-containing protein n=1 Tax=Virgibacillus flavescens TaxID=1611422 RepID=UPI003D33CF50